MSILGKSRGLALLSVSFVLALSTVDGSALAQPKPAAPAAKPNDVKPADTKTAAKPADPKALLASGDKKFKAGDFAGALADFEASNAAKASPEATHHIGQAHDNLNHFAEAVAAYEKFLADVPAKMKDQGEEAKKRVEAIRAMPGKVKVETTPAGAAIAIDGQPAAAGAAPTPTTIELAPGKHTLKLTAEGYEPAERTVDVTFASTSDVKAELTKVAEPPPPPPPAVEPPPPAPPPPPPPEPRSKIPAYVTGAVAIVAAGVGTGFGIKALSQSSDFEKNPTTKKADDGENNALVADMMFGIAVTFGVTSAVLFLSSDAPASAKAGPSKVAPAAPKPRVQVTAAPYVTPSGGGAGALIRF